MRNKWLMSLLIMILALPFFSGAAFAEETVVYEDGEYPITAKALNADTGKRSGAAGFINEDVTLKVQDGEATLTLTMPHNDIAEVTGLQIEGNEPIAEKADKTAKYMEFKLANVTSELNARVQYVITSMPGEHDHAVKFSLEGLNNIPATEEVQPEEPVEPEAPVEGPTEEEVTEEDTVEPEAPVEEPTEEEIVEEPAVEEEQPVENVDPSLVPDEAFTLNFVSESPAVNRQFLNPVALLYKNGEAYIQINGTGGQYFKSLSINGEEVTWGEINEDGTFTVQFKVDGSLSTVLDMGMVISAGPREMTHLLDFTFDESTQVAADVANYTLLVENNDVEVPSEEPTQEENNKPEEQAEENIKTATPEKNPLTPDKAYEIDFVIKHETEDKPSSANSFFKGPAILLEKDGERYIQITVTGKEYIDWLKNKFGEMVVVKEDENSIVYQFKLDSALSEVILLEMQITVPGFYDGKVHEARLFLDESSYERSRCKRVSSSRF